MIKKIKSCGFCVCVISSVWHTLLTVRNVFSIQNTSTYFLYNEKILFAIYFQKKNSKSIFQVANVREN